MIDNLMPKIVAGNSILLAVANATEGYFFEAALSLVLFFVPFSFIAADRVDALNLNLEEIDS